MMNDEWWMKDEGWRMKDEGWRMKDEGWRMKDEGWSMKHEGWWFQAVEGFCRQTDKRTNKRTDICDCRVAFATENIDTENITLWVS